MSRLRPLTPDTLTPEQRALYDDIVSGPRGARPGGFPFRRADGSLTGPFELMLLQPGLGGPLQTTGAQLRYGSTLADDVRESLVLLVSGAWDCTFERHAHEPLARAAGVTDAQLEQLARGALPDGLSADASLALSAVAELLRESSLSEPAYRALVETFGERGVLEIVVLVGYYTTLAMMMKTFAVEAPADAG